MPQDFVICPLCNDTVDKLLYRFHLDGERQVLESIRQQNPSWTIDDGICSRCIDYYHSEIVLQQKIIPTIGPYFPVRTVDDFIVLPTGLRMDADQRYTGKNVTICFVDSGFYPHQDLVSFTNRIKVIVDITDPSHDNDYFRQPHSNAWHGTMTSVVCAGNGYASHGLYKGIACDAKLVLIKVQGEDNSVSSANIEKAFSWILQHHIHHNIRIVNVSLGTDEGLAFEDSRVALLAEQLVAEGIVVVAAAGNNEQSAVAAPANAPSVIAVGGLDDHNDIAKKDIYLYHSSFGANANYAKPELIAPAIWIAAPILPGTKEQVEAETLFFLLKNEKEVSHLLAQHIDKTSLDRSLLMAADVSVKQAIQKRIQETKYISPHYRHVDGTSFAAPIISSIVAQMLEANPLLTPATVRNILFNSAKRLPQFPAERQGFGIIQPRKALQQIFKNDSALQIIQSPVVNDHKKTITFNMRHDCAMLVSLAGNFNQWNESDLLMEAHRDGRWSIEIPLLPEGKYQYKFLIDGKEWIDDVNNPFREPDGFNGFNSIVHIKTMQV